MNEIWLRAGVGYVKTQLSFILLTYPTPSLIAYNTTGMTHLPRKFSKVLEIQNGRTSNLLCEICRRPLLLDKFFTSKLDFKFKEETSKVCGPGSSVGIATDCGLDGPGSNAGGDDIFRPSRPALGPTQPPVQLIPGLSKG